MIVDGMYEAHTSNSLKLKLKDYLQLVKLRLTLTVVFSSAMAFLMATPKGQSVQWFQFWILVLGGTLIVGAANGINQIIERNYDKLMLRTANRPIAAGRMGTTEASIFCLILGITGVILVHYYLNPLASLLGLLSLLSYAFLYTPLKRISPVAVFVGAFPGAIPPMLGWVAVTGNINEMAFALFLIQFFWQFPHFWAIAWVLDEDYKRAGYRLLPSFEGRGKKSALQMVWYALALIPFSAVPYFLGFSGYLSLALITATGFVFLWYAWRLYKSCEVKQAKQLMFFSFLYLPVVLLALVLDKI